jgi:putative hydrolase of the HAD superfamily
MAIKLVIFDLDNTLVITSIAAKDAYQRSIDFIADQHGLKLQAPKLYHHWKKIVQSLKHDPDPIKRQFSYSLNLLLHQHKLPNTYLGQAITLFHREYLHHIVIQKGAKETFQWLKKQSIKIAVSTESMHALAVKKLKQVGLYRQVDILITSNDVGIMKPHPDYYLQVIKTAHIPQDQVLVVGNDVTKDIKPASVIGLQTFLIPPQVFHLGTLIEHVQSLSV